MPLSQTSIDALRILPLIVSVVSLPVVKEVFRRTLALPRFRNALNLARDGNLTLTDALTPAQTKITPVPMTGDVDLKLRVSWCYLPKKNRNMPLGQDARFISFPMQTIGVADGVSGVKGADSGRYARRLMKNAHNYVNRHARNTVDPMRALESAFKQTDVGGASTACIITLRHNSLYAVNLGDSGFMVIRGGKTVYRSTPQQKRFNYPYQLGTSSKFRPRDAEKIVVDVEPGDVVVAATDGLFDNLFDDEIEEVVKTAAKEDDEKVVGSLGRKAMAKSLRDDCVTPFSVAAAKNGFKHSGGKYDDVTVIVASIY